MAQPEIKILDPGNAITTEAPINKVNPEKQKQSKERAKLKKKLETVVKPTKKKNVILQSQSANRIIDKTINQYFSADIKSLQKRLGAQKIPDNLDQETMQKLEFMNEFMRNYHKILQSYLQQPGMLSEGSVIAIISYDYNGNLSFEKFVKSDNHFPQVKHIMQGSIENMKN